MARVRRALLSVSDKRGLVELARGLAALDVELLSTGGTAKLLADAGIPVRQVSDYTGFPEMLDGRVKTLHPKIHGGLLGRRDLPEHAAAMRAHGIEPIDLVAVNLYPFQETVARPGTTLAEAIEQIDIGGPSMLRSAAKNHADVTVLVDPDDYGPVLEELRTTGAVSAVTNRRLAQKVFCATACYDGAIADYLGALGEGDAGGFGASFHAGGSKALDMRYGENPHQGAALYRSSSRSSSGDFLRVAEPLHGKELSYNNVVDIDAALALAEEFRELPDAAIAILKHNTPCGVGLGRDPLEAWQRALATDPESPFGGIVVSTRPWTLSLARAVDELFTEVLIAPAFEPDALELLRKKKARRLVHWHPEAVDPRAPAVRGVAGGLLVQDVDRAFEDPRDATVVTKRSPTSDELRALAFAWRVVKHVKSNAIAFTTADRTLALGGGQTSRVEPVRTARARAERLGISLRGAVLGSDAFFPFPDGLEEAIAAGATAVIQPGGSTRDAEVIAAADAHGVAMVFTGVRHFRH
ncbi:MAG TPA: bifunctional phosphoribosylaminoimidazolecarboxamide formyltransferase/IMP cyclohydrolase [Candidatus Nitrosopolaris sp.]|nr:bifunctional phosphoribosylaminoimidazolecarboxamide formyltransferase/IMP cyclohydrolase [Candidatus Nitrosopolaris sp.]